MPRRGLSLIELMIAISILACGIVLIGRSFIMASGALNISVDKIKALSFLDGRMGSLEEKAKTEELKASASGDTVNMGGRSAVFASEITEQKSGDREEGMFIARSQLSWKEGNRDRYEALATYFYKKKEQQEGA